MPNGSGKTDPFVTTRFHVEIKGVTEGLFTECSGLSVETEVMEYAEGGLNDHVHKLPVRTRFSNIILRRGWVESDELWKWYKNIVAGTIEFRPVSVIMYKYKGENAGQEVARWNLQDAYPVKWSGPNFSSTSNEIAVETLELAHAGWQRQ